jgi:AraC-like DNA-binding protein
MNGHRTHGSCFRMLPLIMIKYTRSASLFLDNQISFERYAERARLPLARLHVPETLVPVPAVWQLYERIARGEGTLPLISGVQSIKASEAIRRSIPQNQSICANTVKAALKSLNPRGKEMNCGGLRLISANAGCWLSLNSKPCAPDSLVQDLIEICFLKHVTELLLPTFVPVQVRIRAKGDGQRTKMLEKLGFHGVKFRTADCGIWIPDTLLACDIGQLATAKHKSEGNENRSLPSTFSSTVLELFESYRRDRWLSLEQLAECVDTPVRTIQRRLAEENTSFSELTVRAKIAATTWLLRNTDQSITGISMEMGLSSSSNFTRAFRKITGFTPSRYREIHRYGTFGASEEVSDTRSLKILPSEN